MSTSLVLTPSRSPWLNPMLVVGLLAALTASLALGPVRIAPDLIWQTLLGGGDRISQAIIIDLRLPRMLLGAMVGGMLGLAGAVLQGYLRNPLAEPSVIGTSNAAAFGAVIALYFGLSQIHPIVLPLIAVGCAIASLLLLFTLAGKAQATLSLILAGIAVSTLAGAGISLALNLSENPFAAMEIMTWLMGSVENRTVEHIWIAAPCILIGMGILSGLGRTLDALSLGEDAATSMGIDLSLARMRLLMGISIGVGGAVAVAGSIGFVGLIVPHLLRPFTDKSPSSLLMPSILAGALLLTLADIAVRLIPSSNELKLGVVTAFLGVPIFILHLLRERQS